MTIRARFALAAALAALAQAAAAQNRPDDEALVPMANPSALVAAELSFARLAQERGQWTAFRRMATRDAVLFMPQAVRAHAWLKGRADPPRAVRWQPHGVFLSCDGSLGVTTGAWQRPDGSQGYFTTLWQRQPNGDYPWLIDHGDRADRPRAMPDAIRAQVAQCAQPWHFQRAEHRHDRKRAPGSAGKAALLPVLPPATWAGESADGTLRWSWAVAADGARRFRVALRQDGAMRTMIDDQVAATGEGAKP